MRDPWLDRWLGSIGEHACGRPILELGCGSGRDTATLRRAGHAVVAIDISATALFAARLRAPGATFHRQDIRAPFPIGEAGVGVVIASLSLHYFPWVETLELVQRIRGVLLPHGALLCRLNSTNDRHFGAIGHERLDVNYYRVQGQAKRFFDRSAIDALFADGWTIRHIEERTIDRYALPKSVWELMLVHDSCTRAAQ